MAAQRCKFTFKWLPSRLPCKHVSCFYKTRVNLFIYMIKLINIFKFYWQVFKEVILSKGLFCIKVYASLLYTLYTGIYVRNVQVVAMHMTCTDVVWTMFVCAFINFFNFNFILPKVKTDYKRQAQVLNIDNLRLIIYLKMKF